VRVLDDGPVRVLDDGLRRPTDVARILLERMGVEVSKVPAVRQAELPERALARGEKRGDALVRDVRAVAHQGDERLAPPREMGRGDSRAPAEASHVERAHRAHVLERQRAKLDVNARHTRDIDDAIGSARDAFEYDGQDAVWKVQQRQLHLISRQMNLIS
jgi:hypothetical protein